VTADHGGHTRPKGRKGMNGSVERSPVTTVILGDWLMTNCAAHWVFNLQQSRAQSRRRPSPLNHVIRN
jgi:hypothetical protein